MCNKFSIFVLLETAFCMKSDLIPVIALLVIHASSLPVVPVEHKLMAICTDSLPVIPAGCKIRGHHCGHISFFLVKLVEHAGVVRGSSLHFRMIIYMYIYAIIERSSLCHISHFDFYY